MPQKKHLRVKGKSSTGACDAGNFPLDQDTGNAGVWGWPKKPHACGGNRWCLADSNIRVLSDESDTKQVTQRWATRKRGWGSAMLSLSFSYSCYGTGLPHIGCHVAILVFSASLPRRVITGQSTDRGRSAVRTSNKKGNAKKNSVQSEHQREKYGCSLVRTIRGSNGDGLAC
jgi:hypothetical protein